MFDRKYFLISSNVIRQLIKSRSYTVKPRLSYPRSTKSSRNEPFLSRTYCTTAFFHHLVLVASYANSNNPIQRLWLILLWHPKVLLNRHCSCRGKKGHQLFFLLIRAYQIVYLWFRLMGKRKSQLICAHNLEKKILYGRIFTQHRNIFKFACLNLALASFSFIRPCRTR